MMRTILISTQSKLQDVYKNDDQIEIIELPDNLIQDLYQSNDYQITIKKNSNQCELLAGEKTEIGTNEYYKWVIKVNSGDIEEFKTILKNKDTKIIEE